MGVEHEVTPNGGGHAIVEALANSIEKSGGAQILYQTEAVRLSVGADGRVKGVVVRSEDGLLRTLAGAPWFLLVAEFEGNAEMLSRYLGPNACDLPLLAPGLSFNQGAGIRMAMEIGAGTSGQFDMIHSELVDRRTSPAGCVHLRTSFRHRRQRALQTFLRRGSGDFRRNVRTHRL